MEIGRCSKQKERVSDFPSFFWRKLYFRDFRVMNRPYRPKLFEESVLQTQGHQEKVIQLVPRPNFYQKVIVNLPFDIRFKVKS